MYGSTVLLIIKVSVQFQIAFFTIFKFDSTWWPSFTSSCS